MKEMRNRVRRITYDLNALLEELAAVPEPNAREFVEHVLTPEVIRAFKSSVDSMRRLLWMYIEAASSQTCCQGSTPQQALTLKGVVDALRALPGTPRSQVAAGGSFIEKVEAIVEKKMSSRPHN